MRGPLGGSGYGLCRDTQGSLQFTFQGYIRSPANCTSSRRDPSTTAADDRAGRFYGILPTQTGGSLSEGASRFQAC